MRLIVVNEPSATLRRVYFHLVTTDGISPATGEDGGQPQISLDGVAWTGTGIGTLTAVGNGRYYAVLTVGTVSSAGSEIETRYKSASTAECPGQSAQVVALNINSAVPSVTIAANGIAPDSFQLATGFRPVLQGVATGFQVSTGIRFTTSVWGTVSTFQDAYKGCRLRMLSGVLEGQSSRITGYDSISLILTVEPVFTTNAADGDSFIVESDAYATGLLSMSIGTSQAPALDAAISSCAPASTALSAVRWTNALATALGTLASHDPGAILASTTNITAAAGIAVSSLGAGVITEASIATPVEATGRPTGMLGMMRRLYERWSNKRTRNRTTGAKVLYGANGTTVLETSTQSTSGVTDQETQGA